MVTSYVLLATEVVVSLLFTPYLIRSLGQAEYGLYSLAASITAYFMLLDAGVGNALVRYIAMYRMTDDFAQQRRLLGLSLVFYAFVGTLIVILGAGLRASLPEIFGSGLSADELVQADALLRLTLLNAAITLVVSTFDRVLVAYERFVLSRTLAIARVLARGLVLSSVLYFGYQAVGVVAANLLLTVAFGIVSAGFVFFGLNLKPSFHGVRLGFLREVMGYSAFVFLQMIAAQINAMTDQVLLGMMTGSVTVGVYAVGAQISNYFQSIAGSMNGVLMPGVVRMVESRASSDQVQAEMIKVGRLVFAVLGIILTGFAVVGRDFVMLWVGRDNSGAYGVALILMTAMILYLTQAIGSQVLWAMGRHKVQAVLNVGVALANIGLTVVLIRWNPLIGASLGTAFAILVGNVAVMNIVFTRSIGISMKEYYANLFRGILPSLALAGMLGVVVRFIGLEGWQGLVVEGLVVLIAYVTAMVAFGMNDYEKRLIASMLIRVRGRQ